MIEGMKVPSKMLNSAIQIAFGIRGGVSLKLATKFPEELILNAPIGLGKNRFDKGLESCWGRIFDCYAPLISCRSKAPFSSISFSFYNINPGTAVRYYY